MYVTSQQREVLMLSIAIVDDGVGIVPTLSKLRTAVSAHFICVMCREFFPLGEKSGAELFTLGGRAVRLAKDLGCNAAVFSSVALTSRCHKSLSFNAPVDIFGCDAPVLHASTYTASRVLLVGDGIALHGQSSDGVICVPMPHFPLLAEENDERGIVDYISQMCEQYSGQFDCIAIANSSMNLYKYCFSRVFPNVKIFDSLEGVARKMRKIYKKYPREDSSCTFVDICGNDIGEKYSFFAD